VYGLSKETDLSFLLRERLERVDVSEHQAQLHFAGAISISIEGECELDREAIVFEQLKSLTGKSVSGATVQNKGTLNIVFDGGRRLSILDSNENYESYQITGPGVNIVV
jgi:hypothetical protein